MTEDFDRELLALAGQSRALLEDLALFGVGGIPVPEVAANLPVCPPQVRGVDRGGEAACREETLEEIRAELEECRRCPLCQGRRNIVFGVGNSRARLVFVGEAPGREEDEKGEPFVGEAGRLLDRILFAMGLARQDVYICNVVKCRPPNNRTPLPDEIEMCSPFLMRQIRTIKPRLVCCLGAPAVKTLLGVKEGITKIRGRFYDFQGTKALPTFHPAYILRNPREEKILREDFQTIVEFLKSPR